MCWVIYHMRQSHPKASHSLRKNLRLLRSQILTVRARATEGGMLVAMSYSRSIWYRVFTAVKIPGCAPRASAQPRNCSREDGGVINQSFYCFNHSMKTKAEKLAVAVLMARESIWKKWIQMVWSRPDHTMLLQIVSVRSETLSGKMCSRSNHA